MAALGELLTQVERGSLAAGLVIPPGYDAFAKLVGHGASITAILPQLGILAAFAVVLLALASLRLRRVLVA